MRIHRNVNDLQLATLVLLENWNTISLQLLRKSATYDAQCTWYSNYFLAYFFVILQII